MKMAVFWDVTASIIRVKMMEAVSISEMSVILSTRLQTTWYNIPEDSHLHTCHCENLKSQLCDIWFLKTLTETVTELQISLIS
jgi:hypothetical protein